MNEILKDSNYVETEDNQSSLWYYLYKYVEHIKKANLNQFIFTRYVFKKIPKFKHLSKFQIDCLITYGKRNAIIESVDKCNFRFKKFFNL